MTQIITLSDKKEWSDYITKSLRHDFYHTWSYHSLDQTGEPLLFVYEQGDTFIALPLIKRPIDNSPYFDLTSVYGYSGPVSNKDWDEISDDFLQQFKTSFSKVLQDGNYISVFSRFHPLLNQNRVAERFGGLFSNGETVAIDLRTSYEEQVQNYHKNIQVSIRQLRRRGFYTKESESDEDIELFSAIYTENMNRIGATDSYYFDKEYFRKFLNAPDFDGKLLFVCKGDNIACGTLISLTNGIIQGHLVGTASAYLPESPARLLVDDITLLGRRLNMQYFHLGGGLGFKKDSLFSWKASFSNTFLPYYSWRYIVNKPVYNSLIEGLNLENQQSIDFFPLYRYQPASSRLVTT